MRQRQQHITPRTAAQVALSINAIGARMERHAAMRRYIREQDERLADALGLTPQQVREITAEALAGEVG